jgi:CHAD domain-containing protein
MTTAETHKNLSLNQFLETQLQLFKGHFLVTQATMDEEAIHQMRLAIKRIRTIQKLKKHIHFPTSLNDEDLIIIKTIFSASGNLRDLQVQLGLLGQYSTEMKFSFTLFMNYFAEKEKCFIDLLDKTIHEINFDRFANVHTSPEENYTISEIKDIETESIDFVKYKIKKISDLLLLPQNTENVHELRKQVKQLFFVLQFMKDYFPGNYLGNYDYQAINDAGDRLGKWHDREVLKARVFEYILTMEEIFIEENPEYQILLYVLEDEKRKILNGLDVKLYVEMIKLRYLLGERAPEKILTEADEITIETGKFE